MKVRIKKLSPNARIPKKAHTTDAGFDLYATSFHYDKEEGNLVYGTGLAFEIPEGYVGYIFPRSSITRKDLMLPNSVGVVDAGYRGEVTFKFKIPHRVYSYSPKRTMEPIYTPERNQYANSRIYEVGERIGQLIIMPIPDIEFEEADELSDSERGTGGYGSSGNN